MLDKDKAAVPADGSAETPENQGTLCLSLLSVFLHATCYLHLLVHLHIHSTCTHNSAFIAAQFQTNYSSLYFCFEIDLLDKDKTDGSA